MNFDYNETQLMIAQSIKDFAEKNIRPYIMEWDEAQIFPIQLFKQLGEMGFMGVLVPEEYGGSGLGYHEYITVVEEISKVDPSIGLSVAAHNSLCTNHILTFGNEEQKKKWLPKLATAEFIGAWGLTEHNTGSDAGGMNTTAVKDGDHWIVNGAKNFITHGISGDVAVVVVRTGEKGDSKGMTAFVFEKGMKGFSSGKKENKLGMRASETAELVFDNCRVPDENRLGEVGEGFVQAMKILDGGRISIGALSLGISKGAYEAALKYSKERKAFGKEISKHQAIAFKLADMATQISAAEMLCLKAACEKDAGQDISQSGAMAKLFASQTAMDTTIEAVQIHGGNGYVREYHVERMMRDAKITQIYEGTSEIQRIVISRSILNA